MTTVRVLVGRPGELMPAELFIYDFRGNTYINAYSGMGNLIGTHIKYVGTNTIINGRPTNDLPMLSACYAKPRKTFTSIRTRQWLAYQLKKHPQQQFIIFAHVGNGHHHIGQGGKVITKVCNVDESPQFQSMLPLCAPEYQLAYAMKNMLVQVPAAVINVDNVVANMNAQPIGNDDPAHRAVTYTRDNVAAQINCEYGTGV